MLLDEATSKEQVEAALEAGDEELLSDIEYELDRARHEWERNVGSYCEYVDEDYSEAMTTDDFIDAVIRDSPAEYDLAQLPRHLVKTELSGLSLRHARGPRERGVFVLDDGGGGYFSYRLPTELRFWFPDHMLPDNHEFIPEGLAEEFWESVGWGITWDETDVVGANYGYGEGEALYISSDADRFAEWARDLFGDYIQNLIKARPSDALDMFLDELPSPLVTSLRATLGLDEPRCVLDPYDELFDLVHRYFSGDEETRSEVLGELEDFSRLTAPSDGFPELIREITRDDLMRAGVTKGTLWEEAPWKLVKLRPSDLRYEGTRMRHCVGDRSMGYIKAVADGDIEIWSLRSRANKPRFTLEVDPVFWDCDRSDERGGAIEQLKGKANRTPGYAQRGATEVKFPEEVLFWRWLFEELGVDPLAVDDFDAYRLGHGLRRNRVAGRSFDIPWQSAS